MLIPLVIVRRRSHHRTYFCARDVTGVQRNDKKTEKFRRSDYSTELTRWVYTVFRKKHPLLFSCKFLEEITNLNDNFRQNS